MYGSQQLEDGGKSVKTAQKVSSQAEFGEIIFFAAVSSLIVWKLVPYSYGLKKAC